MNKTKEIGMILTVALAIVSLAGAGTFTYQPWTSDADSGVSGGKIYTHAVKFNVTDGMPVYAGNGMVFEGDSDEQGTNWKFTNIPNAWGPGDWTKNIAGLGANLIGPGAQTSFVYGDPVTVHPQIQLTQLTPGTKYIATFYAIGWETGNRIVDVSADDDPNDPGHIIRVNEDQYGGGNGIQLKYAYTAPKSGQIIFTFDEVATNASWHHYAFSNEVDAPAYVYIQPQPVPGAFTDLTVNLDFTAIPLPGVTLTNPSYDLYWGTNSAQLTKVAGLTAGSYQLQGLAEETTYYWKVEVFDGATRIYSSDPGNSNKTWIFTTKSFAPATKALEYPMNDPNGTVVRETIGNYNGTAFNLDDPNTGGTAWVPGLIGNSLQLDGIDSYVDLGSEAPVPFGANKTFSISAYFKTTDTEGPIFAFRHSTKDNPILCVAIGLDGADSNPNKLRFISRDDAGTLFRMTGPDVPDGDWNHVVLSRAIDGTVSMYLNGKFAVSLNDGRVAYDVDWRALGADIRWIDAGLGAEQRRFLNGTLDTVTVWEGALKQSQIDEMVDLLPYRINPRPLNGATGVAEDVTLSWSPAVDRYPNATYNIYLGMNPDLTNSLDGATGLTVTQFKPTEPLEFESQYFWKVETVVDGTVVYTSPTWSFVTAKGTVGRFSVLPWTGDADSKIASNKTYTHAVKFNGRIADGAVFTTINGVNFEDDENFGGANWSLSEPARNPYEGFGVNVGGNSANLLHNFFYGDSDTVHPVLTLTGLTVGTQYVTTFYTVGFGDAPGRRVDITVSDNPENPTRIDENGANSGNGQLIKYKFTATTDTISFTFDAVSTGDSWHHYAFSNEVAVPFDLTPSPAPRTQIEGTDVVLSWVPDPFGAAQGVTWNLQLGTDASMATNLIDITGLTEASYSAEGLSLDTQFFWKVSAVRNGQVIMAGPVWTLFTKPITVNPATALVEWKFDDTAGTTLTETYNVFHGTLTNEDPNSTSYPLWVEGLKNNALEFNGINQFVDLPDTTPLTAPVGFAFSLSGYFKTTDPEGPVYVMRHPGILGVYVGYDGADSVPGRLRFISASFGALRRITGPKVDDGRWHHYAVTRSQFGIIEMFVDGVSYGIVDDFNAEYVNEWSAFGTDKQWLNDWSTTHAAEQLHLNGLIDETTIWQGVLQADQIAAMASLIPPLGDVNTDGVVNLADLAIVANGWLTAEVPADINRSGRVDLEDFDILSQDWGK